MTHRDATEPLIEAVGAGSAYNTAPAYECASCQDTGNDARTGYQHATWDEAGCTLCNEPDGRRCCEAIPSGRPSVCAECGHDIVPLPIVDKPLAQPQGDGIVLA